MTQNRPRHRNPHELTIINLWKVLARDNSNDEIWMNSAYRHEKRPVPGKNIFPDGVNFSKRLRTRRTGLKSAKSKPSPVFPRVGESQCVYSGYLAS